MEVFAYLAICIGIGWLAHTKKGRSGIGFFLLSLFTTPIIGGIVLLLVKPNRENIDEVKLKSGDMKKCPYCAEIIKWEATICKYCHSKVSVPERIIPINS